MAAADKPVCRECGQQFGLPDDRRNTAFCSAACRSAGRNKYGREYHALHGHQPQATEETRPCPKCHKAFSTRRRDKKFCSKKCKLSYYGHKYRSHPDNAARLRLQIKDWSRRNPEKRLEIRRKYERNNVTKVQNRNVLKRYGLTFAQVLALGASCHICGVELTRKGGRTKRAVDHDHSTGKIRGVLCGMCNAGLGQFKDNPAFLLAAIQYLARHTAKEIEFTA